MDTYVYRLGETVYINLTNRCSNNCTFCIRNKHEGLGEYKLWLEKEPEAGEVIAELKKESEITEAVFCGFGEPTSRLDVLLEVAKYLKGRRSYVRLDTNGQGSAIAGEDITPKLKGLVDAVSISLNAPSAAEYQKVCRSEFGEDAYDMLLDFAKSCVAQGIDTTMTVVDVIGVEAVRAAGIIAQSAGARFRVRHYYE